MIIRFRSKDGMYRANVGDNEDFELALKQLVDQLPTTDPKQLRISTGPQSDSVPAAELCGRSAKNLGLKHGDLLFATYPEIIDVDAAEPEVETKTNGVPTSSAQRTFDNVKQLPIDDELDELDGKIKRPKDTKMCRHGDKGMCDYCMPLEPYDAGYLEENGIKHTSFHAHLKQLNADKNKTGSSSSYMAPLAEPDYAVKKDCPTGHAPWPQGICSKCQPSAITLQRQTFRMVDHVEFATSEIVNQFIDAWRQTGTQRIGILYGRYEKYEIVPLGIKAVVEAIYEVPQEDEADGVTMGDWESKESIDKVAAECGLQQIGVIYTDLTDAGKGDSTVVCKRHVDSYFLTSLEILFAAQLQVQHPTPCRWSDSGEFSSKYVTCVVSGNINGEIDIATYQASISAEAMVKADLIEASTNPSVMRIKEQDETRYVPEVFYKRINEYKRAVNENAKPAFPVEYLLITLTHGFPSDPSPLFKSTLGSFPIENRQHLGTSQDLHALGRHLKLRKGGSQDETPLDAVSDFHTLAFIASIGVLSDDELKLLVKTALTGDVSEGYKLLQTDGWRTLTTIIQESM